MMKEQKMYQEHRQTAEGLIKDRCARLERERISLEHLLAALPRKLSPEADQALYDLMMKRGW